MQSIQAYHIAHKIIMIQLFNNATKAKDKSQWNNLKMLEWNWIPGSRLANVMNHWSDAIRVQRVEAPKTLSRLIALLPFTEPAEWGERGRLTRALVFWPSSKSLHFIYWRSGIAISQDLSRDLGWLGASMRGRTMPYVVSENDTRKI